MKKILAIGLILGSSSILAMEEVKEAVEEKTLETSALPQYEKYYYNGISHLWKNPSGQWMLVTAPPYDVDDQPLSEQEVYEWKQKMSWHFIDKNGRRIGKYEDAYQEELKRNGKHYNSDGKDLHMQASGKWMGPTVFYLPNDETGYISYKEETGAHYNSYGEKLFQTSSCKWEKAPTNLKSVYIKSLDDTVRKGGYAGYKVYKNSSSKWMLVIPPPYSEIGNYPLTDQEYSDLEMKEMQ